ncbi:hypothetical protein TD95_003949 [Thielaviopsis punctulata]|uniref:DUF1279 domain-containing protein n=1 Tax=Thielaviopsis punctulata TaxID=72032 RepID=A0A0F4ZEQ9_9PEZI|nr:hypothetical protein TD95_003949 [Thielaviopsis punctulata]
MSRLFFKLPTRPPSQWVNFQFFAHAQSLMRATSASTISRRALSTLRHTAPTSRSAARSRMSARTLTQAGSRVRFNSNSSAPEKVREAAEKFRNKADAGKEQTLSLGQRLKKLSKEYGWVALGVYMGISTLDFPLCFVLVRVAGEERIGHLEHVVVSTVSKAIPESVKTGYHNLLAIFKKSDATGSNSTESTSGSSKGASLGTQLALAYAIHKSLIFIRVPLTAALTPKVVQILRGWGYQIGKNVVKK